MLLAWIEGRCLIGFDKSRLILNWRNRLLLRFLLALTLGLASTCVTVQGATDKHLGPSLARPGYPPGEEGVIELASRAKSLVDAGAYAEALPLQLRALAIREKSLGPNHPDTALALNELAITYVGMGQYEKALPLQIRALANLTESRGSEHPDVLEVLNRLAATYAYQAQYDKALPIQLRVLEIREKVLGAEHQDTAVALNDLALTYFDLARYDRALPLQVRAIKILEKTLGPKHPKTALGLNNLAWTHSAMANHETALQLHARALSIREEVLGAEHPDTATGLNFLAWTYGELAQYDKALPLQLRALAIREKSLGPNHPDTAVTLNNLAITYVTLGQYEKALPLQIRSLTIHEEAFGPEHPETAKALANLAVTYTHLKQYDRALPIQLGALEISEKVLGAESPEVANALGGLGNTHYYLADYEKAKLYELQALEIREKSLGPNHPDTAVTLNNLAITYVTLGQYEKALPLQIRSLTIHEEAFGPEHPETAKVLASVGYTLILKGRLPLGITLLKSAVNSMQTQREAVSRIGRLELKGYSDTLSFWYQLLADTLVETGRLAEAHLVLDMIKEDERFEFIRRASKDDPRITSIGYASIERTLLARYRQLAERVRRLGAEASETQERVGTELLAQQESTPKRVISTHQVAKQTLSSFIEESHIALLQEEQTSKVDNKEFESRVRESQQLLKMLGDDVALLQYYVANERIGILLTTAGIQLAQRTVIDIKELNTKVAQLRRMLRNPKSTPVPLAQELYRVLIAPVEQDLIRANAKTVMLSLDGPLRYLPFGALHDGERYLIERWSLPVYTSITKARLLEAVSENWRAAGLGVTKPWPDFEPLAGVKREIEAIVKTDTGGVIPGEIYLDSAFTAQRLKDVSGRDFPVVHVASHFRFSPGTEINSFLLLGNGERLTLGDIRAKNYRFDNVDLLTLSACDTALGGGRDEQGREIEGFGVTAQKQGAKAVLATLWAVADESTSVLMSDFYSRRQSASLTTIEALRLSQVSMSQERKYAHPYYWAPFILMGNWR
jgi:CHAT domain-containing protein